MKTILTFLFSMVISIVFSQNTSFVLDVNDGCYPLSVNFTNNSSSNAGDYFVWEFNDGTSNLTSFEGNHVYNRPGNYELILRQYNYADEEIGSEYHNINVKGVDSILTSTGYDACPNEKVWFQPYTDGNYNFVKWKINGDSIFNYTANYIFDTPGMYDIVLIVNTISCGLDTINTTINITSAATPLVDFYTNGTNEICTNDQMMFYSQFPAESYSWDFDDGTSDTLNETSHSFTTTGGKNVTLTATNICGNSSSTSHSVNVRNDIAANAEFSYNSQGTCPNTAISFNAYYTGSYNWTFDDITTSTIQNPEVIFSDTGYYQVQLIITNGCNNSDTSKIDSVHIFYNTDYKPDAAIEFNMNNSHGDDTIRVCPGEEVLFSNYTYPFQAVNYNWNFGDGDTSDIRKPTHIFDTPGINTITYVAINQCMGTDTAYLWVNVDNTTTPNNVLGVMPDTICPGENAYFIDFNGGEGGSEDEIPLGTIYNLDFGDGQTLNAPTNFSDSTLPIFNHLYTNLGVYHYIFTVENLCGNSKIDTGSVFVLNNAHQPEEYLLINSTDTSYNGKGICPQDPVQFIIIGGSSYEWHFGDGETFLDTNQVIYHAYSDTGYYDAFVVVTTNCGDVDTIHTPVSISGGTLPKAYFDIQGNGFCSGETVTFDYNDGGYISEYYSYVWEFGDDSVAYGQNVSHVYDGGGEYNVVLQVTNGCGTSEEYRNVYVNSPILSFTVTDNVVIPNEDVVFTNTSSNAISYTWNFGDGNTSNSVSPTHSYLDYGYNDITLSATNNAGCTSTETWPAYILVSDIQIDANIIDQSCANASNTGNYDGSISISIIGGLPPYEISCQELAGNTSEFTELQAGDYHFTIIDANGTSINKTFAVNTPDIMQLNAVIDTISCYNTNDGKITVNVTGGVPPYNYEWKKNSATYPNNTNIISDLDAGSYSLMVSDANNCMDNYNVSGMEYYWVLYSDNNPFYGKMLVEPNCSNNDGYISIFQTQENPLSIEWFDSSVDNTINNGDIVSKTNLTSDVYQVIITDNVTSCVDSLHIILNDNSPINVQTIQYTSTVCEGDNNGSVQVEANGGTGNYTYHWSSNVDVPTQQLDNGKIVYHLTSDEYVLRVYDINSTCIHFESYPIEEIEAPELFFTKVNPICYGEYTGSAIVHPLSDDDVYYYEWSNGSENDNIENRAAGTYTVTVTGGWGCSSVASVSLENPAEMTLTVNSSDATYYGADNGIISILVNNGQPIFVYEWSGLINQETNISEELAPGQYFITVTDNNFCTASGSAIINEPAMINISIFANNTSFCYGETTNIEAPYSTNYTYQWSTGETTDIITVNETGTYTVTVNNGVSIGIDSVEILVSHPYTGEKICMVSVDTASMYNVLMWNKTEDVGIVEYKIYKLFGTQYLEIGSQLFDEYSEYVDSSSQPNVHADRYKISIVDTCGNESELSKYHQTMYLGVSDNTFGSNTIVILDWDEASVNENEQEIDWYYIYRGNGVIGMSIVDSISGVFTGWNDNNALSSYYYRVAYNVEEACYPTSPDKTSGGPYNQSVSNIDEYSSGPLEIDELSNSDELEIYPNPFFDRTRIFIPEEAFNNSYSIKITDATGKRVLLDEKLKTRIYTLYRNNLPNGVYFVEIKGDKTYRKKLIIN